MYGPLASCEASIAKAPGYLDGSAPLSSLLDKLRDANAEIDRLRELEAAAHRVCKFNWSDDDTDAVAAFDALRRYFSSPEDQR